MSKTRASFRLSEIPAHLGLGATVVPQELFTGEPAWYERYAARHIADGAEGRLVTMHTFSAPWDSWEVHPLGEELVVCVDGEMTLYQEHGSEIRRTRIGTGDAIVNPRGVWHTADVAGTATALFITAGSGTENRRR
jgi:quercetin dioxygenase-like cupin family protein